MSEITEEQVRDAIQNCHWRDDNMGVPVCIGMCQPCQSTIESGQCDTLIRLSKEAKVK